MIIISRFSISCRPRAKLPLVALALATMSFATLIASANTSIAGDFVYLANSTLTLPRLTTSTRDTLRAQFRSEWRAGRSVPVLVQYQDLISTSDRERITLAGIPVLRYLPDDVLVVAVPSDETLAWLSAQPHVRSISKFEAEWKMSSALVSLRESTSVSVKLFDARSAADAVEQLSAIPGVRMLDVSSAIDDGVLTLEADPSAMARVAAQESVEWLEPSPALVTWTFDVRDVPRVAATPTPSPSSSPTPPAPPAPPAKTGYESGTKIIGVDRAYTAGNTGQNQIVAIADTGVDVGDTTRIHPDLTGVLQGFPVGFGSTGWNDLEGHGTHVAGSIIGNGASSGGKIRGSAPGAKLVVQSLYSPISGGLSFSTNLTRLFSQAATAGARIHSDSWGNGSEAMFGAYDTMAVSADTYVSNNPDVLVLFAAGNSGQDLNRDGLVDENSIGPPATAKNILTVGASESLFSAGGIQRPLAQLRDGTKKWGVEPLASDTLSNNPNGIAAFSSRGPTRDGRLKPDVVAPGTNIISTRSHDPNAGLLWGEYDANYVYAGGTSMATPITAGAAALVRNWLVTVAGKPNPSAALLKAKLIDSATDLAPGQFGAGPKQELLHRPDAHQGYGRVDVAAATSPILNTALFDERIGLATGELYRLPVTLSKAGHLRATLVWTDAPGSSAAGKALVNDLDIAIYAQDGRAIAEKIDHLNNVQMIELPKVEAGEYTVVVTGFNVPMGVQNKQGFALIVSAPLIRTRAPSTSAGSTDRPPSRRKTPPRDIIRG